MTYGLNVHTNLQAVIPSASTKAESTKAMSVSDLVRATIAEFGSCNGFILQDSAVLAEIAKMDPTEVLPCSTASMQDSPTNDMIRASARIFLCFVKYLLDTVRVTCGQSVEMIDSVTEITWERSGHWNRSALRIALSVTYSVLHRSSSRVRMTKLLTQMPLCVRILHQMLLQPDRKLNVS